MNVRTDTLSVNHDLSVLIVEEKAQPLVKAELLPGARNGLIIDTEDLLMFFYVKN